VTQQSSQSVLADGSTDPVRVGLNGFGRIGRNVFRAALGNPSVELVGINDVMDDDQMEYLGTYDSVAGRLEDLELEDGELTVGDSSVPVFDETDPGALPWDDLDVDVALECTGLFRTYDEASSHVDAGAEKAIISAPPTGSRDVLQVVYGVNHTEYDGEAVVSNASCTTNSVAPAASVLEEEFGIESGLLTTVHSYTGSQALIDSPAEKTRRGRAAAENIVPTTTGAAKAATEVLPALEGKLDGMAMRVPTPNGSITDLTVDLSADVPATEINDAFRAAASGRLEGVLGVTDDEVVSRDIVGQTYSSLIDANSTRSIEDGLCKVLAWYDNEFGFANRMLDVARYIDSA